MRGGEVNGQELRKLTHMRFKGLIAVFKDGYTEFAIERAKKVLKKNRKKMG